MTDVQTVYDVQAPFSLIISPTNDINLAKSESLVGDQFNFYNHVSKKSTKVSKQIEALRRMKKSYLSKLDVICTYLSLLLTSASVPRRGTFLAKAPLIKQRKETSEPLDLYIQ